MINGGVLMILRSSLERKSNNIKIKATNIENCLANAEGGTLFLENDGINLVIEESFIKNTTARYSSGGFL